MLMIVLHMRFTWRHLRGIPVEHILGLCKCNVCKISLSLGELSTERQSRARRPLRAFHRIFVKPTSGWNRSVLWSQERFVV